ncbi:hypothetical protein [Campylobacter pinnipediorum]|uniref:hypothetical protein n=1 Tax=Campylobacter pinnipediorum TaxID=1965231 RepID=UPI001E648012|nr:hypothetical protein [Campylobacter pinnipediorum]
MKTALSSLRLRVTINKKAPFVVQKQDNTFFTILKVLEDGNKYLIYDGENEAREIS